MLFSSAYGRKNEGRCPAQNLSTLNASNLEDRQLRHRRGATLEMAADTVATLSEFPHKIAVDPE